MTRRVGPSEQGQLQGANSSIQGIANLVGPFLFTLSFAYSIGAGNDPELFRMNADGSDLRQLTTNGAADGDADWSPDGRQIVFESNRDGDPEIFRMRLDGTGVKKITRNRVADVDPAWSPSGNRIVFASRRAGDFEIFTMTTGGGLVTQLTRNTTVDGNPDWQRLPR